VHCWVSLGCGRLPRLRRDYDTLWMRTSIH
jgi:hypothetical protein